MTLFSDGPQEHYMVRFIAVADDEMILSAGLEKDLKNIKKSYRY